MTKQMIGTMRPSSPSTHECASTNNVRPRRVRGPCARRCDVPRPVGEIGRRQIQQAALERLALRMRACGGSVKVETMGGDRSHMAHAAQSVLGASSRCERRSVSVAPATCGR